MPTKKPSHAAYEDDTTPETTGPREVPTDYHDDQWVEVIPPAGLASAYATALLDAAERLGYDPGHAVPAIGGGFRVTNDVLDAADLPSEAAGDGHQVVHTPLDALDRGATPDAPDDAS